MPRRRERAVYTSNDSAGGISQVNENERNNIG